MRFEQLHSKIINSFLSESSLASDLFYYPSVSEEPALQSLLLRQGGVKPLLNDMVKRQIVSDLEGLNSIDLHRPGRVHDYVIVGDCLKPYHTVRKNSPVEVVVWYDLSDVNEMLHGRISKALSIINGRMLAGSQRKVFYYLKPTPIDKDDYSSIYHPSTNSWVKEPTDLLSK